MSGRVTRLVDVLTGVADLTGVDYTRQLSVSQRGAMIRLVREHAAAVWEEYPWPETVRVEDRYFAAEWSSEGGVTAVTVSRDVVGSTTDTFVMDNRSLLIGMTVTSVHFPVGTIIADIISPESESGTVVFSEAKTSSGTSACVFSYDAPATVYAVGDVRRVTDADGSATYYELTEADVAVERTCYVVVDDANTLTISAATDLELYEGQFVLLIGAGWVEIEALEQVGNTYTVTITGHGATPYTTKIGFLSPPADSEVWTETGTYLRELELAATGETEMYRVFAVYSEDPDVVANPAEERFELIGGVIRLEPDAVGRVWVEFQIVPPALNASVWTSAQAVVVGDVRYYETGNYGDCYEVLTAHNSEVPVGSAKWRKVEVPASIASAVKYLASADLLRADGKEDTARAREGKAQEALERAMSSFNNHQHQGARWRARVAA